MTGRGLPPGYEAVWRGGVRGFSWATATDWLAVVLGEGTVYEWAGRRAEETRPGRGPVHVVEAPIAGPDGAPRWAVRHYRRGGAVAPLLGDRYWAAGRTRPERELDASLHARARGIRTPSVVAGVVYRSGSFGAAGFYRADLVTELVPGARSLADRVREGSDLGDALRAAGALVRTLERAAILHPDLNAGNVMLDATEQAWVVDLDRARPLPRPTPRAGTTMLARLERSLARLLAASSGGSLAPGERHALRAGFEGRA